MSSSKTRLPPPELEVILAAHGEAETAGFFENFRVGHRTLAHSAEVMHLPAPLRWAICTLGALRKRLANRPGSPHNAWTRAQALALAERLETRLGQPVAVRAAFASSEPSVEALIARPSAARRRIFISMSPSDSRLSCGLLCHALSRAATTPQPIQVMARLWDDPDFVALNAAHVQAACARDEEGRQPTAAERTALLLVFHGTLIRDQRGQTPQFHAGLDEKIRFASALQAALSGHPETPWSEILPAYLNHDVAGTWSRPMVEDVLEDWHQRGFERVWVFPCDFPVEGSEITGSLSKALAASPIREIRLVACLNDSARFIDYLATRVQRLLDEPAGPWRCDPCPLSRLSLAQR